MSKFKKAFEAIDFAIASGAVTSTDMLSVTMNGVADDAVKRRLMCYILEYHMDEDLEFFLHDTMGYDSDFHRIEVDLEGNITF